MDSEETEGDKLPDGWILCQSKSSPGKRYFFNTKTRESFWTQPQDEDDPEQKKQKEKIGIREKKKKIEAQKKNLKRKGEDEDDVLSNKKQRPESTPDSTSPSPTKPSTSGRYLEPKPILKCTPLKPILTKNSANTRLSQLRARLSNEAQSSDVVDSPCNQYMIPRTPAPCEQKTVRFDLKTPPSNEFKHTIRSPTSDSLNSTPSTSKFFAANKLRARQSNEAQSSDVVDSSSNQSMVPRTPAPFEQKTVRFDLKTPPINEFKHTIRSPTSDSLDSTPSTSNFFAANKIISSMKAHLPEQLRNFRPKDTFAEIEDGIYNHTADHPFELKHRSPPQFSEASKLMSAIKSKLDYTPPKHRDERKMQNRDYNDKIGNFMSTEHTGLRMNSSFPPQSPMSHKNDPRYKQNEFMGTRHDQMRPFVPNKEQTCGITTLPSNMPTFSRPTDPRQDKMRAFVANVRQLNNIENNKQKASLPMPTVEHINFSDYKARNCMPNKNINIQQPSQMTDTLRAHVPNKQNVEENMRTRLAHRKQFEENIRSQNLTKIEEKPKTPYNNPINQEYNGPRLRNSIQSRLRNRENISTCSPNRVQLQDRLRSDSTPNVEHTQQKLRSCLVNRVHVEEKPRSYPPIRQQIEDNRIKNIIEAALRRRPIVILNKVQIDRLRPPALNPNQEETTKTVTHRKKTIEPKTAHKTPERVEPTTSIEEKLEKLDQKTTPQTQNIVNHKKEEVQTLKSNQEINAETVLQIKEPVVQTQMETTISEPIKETSAVVQTQMETTISEPIKETSVSSTLTSNQEIVDVVMNIDDVNTSNMVTQVQKPVKENISPSKVISLVPYCSSPDIEIIDDEMESDGPETFEHQDIKLPVNVPSNKMETVTQQRNETITNEAQNQDLEDQKLMKFTPVSPKFEDANNKSTYDTIIIESDSDSDSPEEVQTFSSAKERMEDLRKRLSKEAEEMPEITDPEFLNGIKLPSPNVITDEEVLKYIELPKSSEEAMEVDCKEDLEPSLTKRSLQNMDPNADIVLVVDTNIFIHELDVILNVLNSHIKGSTQQPTLLVPRRVITELDRLKDNNNGNGAICKRARAAMNYLYEWLPENDRVKGQSLRDSNSHIYPCEIPDDEILNCCLQQQERGKSVILLSNDKNLCIKAVINGVRCIDATDELKLLLESKPQASADPDLWDTVKHCEAVMYQLLANILENEMRAKYHNLWQHVIFKAPPWSLRDVLQCLLKHWIAVFDEVFPRIEHLITDLKNTVTCIQKKDMLSLKQSDVANFKELCLGIAKKCLIIPEYMELAKATVERLQRKACEDLTEMAVIDAFERLWIVFSSYCAQLCAATGLECTLEDKLGNNMSMQELSDKWPVYSAQLYALTLAIKGCLCLNNEELSEEQVEELEDAFKESLMYVQMDTSRVNKDNLRIFCTKCRLMLQEASTKLTGLTELLNVCKQRMDTM